MSTHPGGGVNVNLPASAWATLPALSHATASSPVRAHAFRFTRGSLHGTGADARAATVNRLGSRAQPIESGLQPLVSYLVRSTPSENVRVSTSFRFTQLSRAVKNGVPPPNRTG